jgi:two-component system response regulator LytT
MRVVIMEDEIRSADELLHLLKMADPVIQVMTRLESVEQALEWFDGQPCPDLIIADIQLADGLSLDVFKKISCSCPVIFCTAFDEYVLQVFDTCAVSYLLKPVTLTKLQEALQKLANMRQMFTTNDQWINRLDTEMFSTRRNTLLVNERERIIPLPVSDIAFCYLNKGTVQLYDIHGHNFSYQATLDEMEKLLDPEQFCRANRQFIVNRKAVRNAERYFARKLIVRLNVPIPETIIVSKARATHFLKWLQHSRY